MGFVIGTTIVPGIFEATWRHVLGQAMDLNCLTWVLSLALAKQWRLHAISLPTTASMCSLPIGAIQAIAGGDKVVDRHPWTSWDVMREVIAQAAGVATSETPLSHGVKGQGSSASQVAI